jgi:hypothetical protein
MARKVKRTNVERAMEAAGVSRNIAGNALMSVYAQGAILESLIATLCDNEILPRAKLPSVFLGAAALVQSGEDPDERQREMARAMCEIIRRVAEAHGVEIAVPEPAAETPFAAAAPDLH